MCLRDRFRAFDLHYVFLCFIFSYASPWRRIGVTFPTSCVVVVVFALVLSTSSTLSTHYYLPSHLCCVPRIEIRGTRPPYFLPLLSESRWPGVWCVFSSTVVLEGRTSNLRKTCFPQFICGPSCLVAFIHMCCMCPRSLLWSRPGLAWSVTMYYWYR